MKKRILTICIVMISGMSYSQSVPTKDNIIELSLDINDVISNVKTSASDMQAGILSRREMISSCPKWGSEINSLKNRLDPYFKSASLIYRDSLLTNIHLKSEKQAFLSLASISTSLYNLGNSAFILCIGKNTDSLDGQLALLTLEIASMNLEITNLKLENY